MEERYNKWIYDFMESWKNLNWEETLNLISKDCKYYENPIDDPCNSFDDIVNLWNVVADNQKDISYSYKIISFDNNICIVNWQMTRTMTKTNATQEIDGIFQISLDDDNKCNLFKQWRFTREINN